MVLLEFVKQISEVEERPFTSSLNICQETSFPADPWMFHLKTTSPLFSCLTAYKEKQIGNENNIRPRVSFIVRIDFMKTSFG